MIFSPPSSYTLWYFFFHHALRCDSLPFIIIYPVISYLSSPYALWHFIFHHLPYQHSCIPSQSSVVNSNAIIHHQFSIHHQLVIRASIISSSSSHPSSIHRPVIHHQCIILSSIIQSLDFYDFGNQTGCRVSVWAHIQSEFFPPGGFLDTSRPSVSQ